VLGRGRIDRAKCTTESTAWGKDLSPDPNILVAAPSPPSIAARGGWESSWRFASFELVSWVDSICTNCERRDSLIEATRVPLSGGRPAPGVRRWFWVIPAASSRQSRAVAMIRWP